MSALVEPGQERLLLSSHGKAAPKVAERGARGARSGSGSGDGALSRPGVDAVGS